MQALVLGVVLAAWPLPPDAGRAEYAQPASWPNDPDFAASWPLFSFVPAGWALSGDERDAGAGLGIDRAWSFTRGRPDAVIAVAQAAFDLRLPALQHAWKLNPGELPGPLGADAGFDVNGDGRFDVRDYETDPRVGDRNGNGIIDLDDLQRAFANGQDDDGDGLTDDLCGWDFALDRPIAFAADAGVALLSLVAPVNDGLPGVGVCPDCMVLPLVTSTDPARIAAALAYARRQGAKVVQLEPAAAMSAALDAELARADDAGVVVLSPTPDALTWRQDPLSSHPLVLGVRSLVPDTADPSAAITLEGHDGCGGRSISASAGVPVGRGACATDGATLLAGAAGLLASMRELPPAVVRGLLSGPHVDVGRAMERVAAGEPMSAATFAAPEPFSLVAQGGLHVRLSADVQLDVGAGTEPAAFQPVALDGGEGVADLRALIVPGGLAADANAYTMTLRARRDGLEWRRVEFAMPDPTIVDTARAPGLGAIPPRFLDVTADGSDELFLFESDGTVRLRDAAHEWAGPALRGTLAMPPAFIDLAGSSTPELASVSIDGVVDAQTVDGVRLTGFPVELGAPVPGSLAAAMTQLGPVLVVVTAAGDVHELDALGHERPGFPVSLGVAQTSSPAVGDIDHNGWPDIAIANGTTLEVVFTDADGVADRWSQPTTARQVVLGDLVDDNRLELVADGVFRADGEKLLAFQEVGPIVGVPAIAAGDVIVTHRLPDGVHLALLPTAAALSRGLHEAFPTDLAALRDEPSGGLVIGDVDGDGVVDVIVGTADYRLIALSTTGVAIDRDLFAGGSVSASPAIGLMRDYVSIAAVTTTGQAQRWVGQGFPEKIAWDGWMHDPWNSGNAETPLPVRVGTHLGNQLPPDFKPKSCACGSLVDPAGLGVLAMLRFAVRRRRKNW